MFKKIFSRSKDKPASRTLDHPQKLKAGDIIKIGFDEHSEISNTELVVEKVTGLDLSAKTGFERRVFHLGQSSDQRPLLMWIHDEGKGEELAFAYGATQPHVEAMLNMDQFGELFDPDRNFLVEVKSQKEARGNNPWLAKKYLQDQAHEVYWLDNDPQGIEISEEMSHDEQPCDYFRLSSKDNKAALEVFIFEGGRTDVYFIKYLPLYKIEEMMPSK